MVPMLKSSVRMTCELLFGEKRFCFGRGRVVGGSSAFGNKGKVIFVAGCSGNINFG